MCLCVYVADASILYCAYLLASRVARVQKYLTFLAFILVFYIFIPDYFTKSVIRVILAFVIVRSRGCHLF